MVVFLLIVIATAVVPGFKELGAICLVVFGAWFAIQALFTVCNSALDGIKTYIPVTATSKGPVNSMAIMAGIITLCAFSIPIAIFLSVMIGWRIIDKIYKRI